MAEETAVLPLILIILAAAIVAVSVFRRLRITPVLGYLVAGVLIGPHGIGFIRDVDTIETLAEFGVVFLLFAIGLELSIDRLIAMRKHVFGLGTLQVVITAAIIWAGLNGAGLEPGEAFVLAGGLALSSTAVVLRLLQDRGEMHTRSGRMALSILLLQDIAVIPLITVVPLLGGEEAALLPSLGQAGLKAAVAFGAIVLTGRLLLRPVLRTVAGARTPELFTGVTLFLALGVSWLTAEAGLSMALGAFLAGLLISETEFRHQVEGSIEPFRGLLLALFFMTIGMEIDVLAVFREPLLILGAVAALLAIKAVVISGLARVFGQPWGGAVFLGFTMAGAGEFAFVLFTLGMGAGALSPEVGRPALLVVGLTIALTPLMMGAGRAAARRMSQVGGEHQAELLEGAEGLERHVLILGLGRAGRTVAHMLSTSDVPYLGLDVNADAVAEDRKKGMPVFYGDASRMEVLRAAGVERAAAVVITLNEAGLAERALRAIREHDADLPVLVRAHDTEQSARMTEAGATWVVPELVEGSLQIGGRLLQELGQPAERIEEILEQLRADGYRELDDVVPGEPAAV